MCNTEWSKDGRSGAAENCAEEGRSRHRLPVSHKLAISSSVTSGVCVLKLDRCAVLALMTWSGPKGPDLVTNAFPVSVTFDELQTQLRTLDLLIIYSG